MKWVSVVFLVLGWTLWLAARFAGQDFLSGWAFVVAYAGLGTGLLLASGLSGVLGTVMRLIGLGFLSLAAGELGWLTLFETGSAGDNVIMPNIPYYIADAFFVVAALKLYLNGAQIFGFPSKWLFISAVAAVLLVALLTLPGLQTVEADLGFWLESLSNTVNAFTSILLICIAFLTAGGAWSRWTLPLAVGFGLYMLGNVYYTLTADTYAYGSPADWLWLLGVTSVYTLLLRQEKQVG